MTDTLQMTMTVTDAGRAAVTNAQSNGLSAEITHIAIGSGSGTPAASDTALVNEIKRLPAGTGSNPSPSELYTETSDFSGESYSVYEFAAVLSDGTLLAVYRQSTPIIETTSVVPLLLQISIPIKSFPPGSVVINGDTNFQTPPATESMRGVAEVATQAEVDAGTDHQRMVTAKTLTSRLASFTRNATESVKGFVEIATQSEVDSGTDHQRTVTPKTLKSRLASFARGATESVKGFVEIATQSEVDSGTDHQRTVTPKTLKSRLASFARGATESVKGFVEIATQTEVNTGTDDSRAVTPKKLWGLLSAKFARTDTRPSFQQGVYLNNKPIVMNEAGSTNIDHIWYDDQEGIGTYHFVADSNEQATGNANLKMGGIQLSSGNNVTGVSDSTSSTSTATLASSKAVKSATDAGTRQATESTRGQLEVATQTEANSSTDDSRALTAKKLHNRTATESRRGVAEVATQAEVDGGTDDSRMVTAKKLRWGFSADMGSVGYIALPSWLGGFVLQWTSAAGSGAGSRTVSWPVAFPDSFLSVMTSMSIKNSGTGGRYAYWQGATNQNVTVYASGNQTVMIWGVGR